MLQMLEDRGYVISDAEKETMDFDGFMRKYGESEHIDKKILGMTVKRPNLEDPEGDATIMVFFITEPKVGVKAIKDVAMHMKEEQDSTSKVSRSIIIIEEKITPFARQSLTEMQPKIMIEVFKEAELLVNITHHVLVPKHRVLSPMEKKTLLERYKVKETQLPRIQFNDPIARYYGMARGQVVRIVRSSETAGRYVTYRFCV